MAEILGNSATKTDYLNDDYLTFRDGKLFPNERPGLGVEFDEEAAKNVRKLKQIMSGAVTDGLE